MARFIAAWVERADARHLGAVRGKVLIPDDDRVLDPASSGACGTSYDLWGNAPHWYDAGELAPARRELEMSWSDVGQSGGLVLDDPLDLSGGRLELRTIVDPLLGDVRLVGQRRDHCGLDRSRDDHSGVFADRQQLADQGGIPGDDFDEYQVRLQFAF